MFKRIDKFHVLLISLFFCIFLIAAAPSDVTRFTSLFIGSADDSPDVTPGEDDLYVKGTFEVDGAVRFDAGLTREVYFPMAGWAVDGGDDIDEATAPDIGDDDNIPSITWDNSGETGAIQQTVRLPSNYISGLTLYCLVSSDTDVAAAGKLDWRIWVNNDSAVFDATAIEQAVVSMGSTSDPNVSNEVLTLTVDATGETALTAGTWVTVDLFNATTHASGNLELKGVQGVYTATH